MSNFSSQTGQASPATEFRNPVLKDIRKSITISSSFSKALFRDEDDSETSMFSGLTASSWRGAGAETALRSLASILAFLALSSCALFARRASWTLGSADSRLAAADTPACGPGTEAALRSSSSLSSSTLRDLLGGSLRLAASKRFLPSSVPAILPTIRARQDSE